MNVGGGLPGTGDRATQGSPAKIAYCVAENEAENPWEPLHVEAGLPRRHQHGHRVRLRGPAQHPGPLQQHRRSASCSRWPGAMGQAGSNNLLGRGWPLLSLGPEHAATIARDGYSKQQVKEFLFEHARYPLARLGQEYQRQQVERWDVVDAPDTMVPIVETADDISVIVAGGAGKHSSWQPTFGDGTHWTRRTIPR